MSNTIRCPKCGKDFEVSEALKEHIRQEEIEKIKLEKEKEISEYKRRAENAEQNELAFRKEKEVLEEEKRKFELEKQRQLDKERESIRIKAAADQSEKDKYVIAEYQEQMRKMSKDLEEANRRAKQGSQQLQGEVQELDLEETLKKVYPYDEIGEVKKGELGADVRQRVKSPRGTYCGTILWESKRTKVWGGDWVSKLKEDLRRDKAHIAVIVSDILPKEFKREVGELNGVWIIKPAFLIPISALLRKNLLDVAKEKFVAVKKQDTAGELYDLVTGHEFTQQIDRMVETYFEMRNQVGKERAAFERIWKAREIQIDRLIGGLSGIYGSMKEVAGSALPEIDTLKLEE